MIELLRLILSALVFSLVSTALYALYHAITKKTALPIGRTALVAAFSAYTFAILYVTLLSRPAIFFTIELDPIASYRRAANAPAHLAAIEIRNVLLNIVMFIPLGIFLPLATPRFRKFCTLLPAALIAALAIETTQLATRRGVFSVEDILHNTLGAALGLALFLLLTKIFKNP